MSGRGESTVPSDAPRLWRLRRLIHDVRCGRHSAIPPCCIVWFIGPWRWMSGTWLRGVYWDCIPEEFQHIGCPRCIWRDEPAEVRDCRCGPYDWFSRILLDLEPDPVERESLPDGIKQVVHAAQRCVFDGLVRVLFGVRREPHASSHASPPAPC